MQQKRKNKKESKSEDKIPIIYLFIFSKILEKYSRGGIVYAKNLIEILRRTVYQMPGKYDYFILEELEEFKLVKKLDRYKYEIIGGSEKLKELNEFFLW